MAEGSTWQEYAFIKQEQVTFNYRTILKMTRKKPKKAENWKKSAHIFHRLRTHSGAFAYLTKLAFLNISDKLYFIYSLIQLITASSEIVRTIYALAIFYK